MVEHEQQKQRKSGVLTDAEKAVYRGIEESVAQQRETYRQYLEKSLGAAGQEAQRAKAAKWGFDLDVGKGRLRYRADFKPLQLPYKVLYVRHGKTEGNTEPRVYQGDVDYWDNQLTDVGKRQAEEAAERIEQLIAAEAAWRPDVAVLSPLHRARATAEPWLQRHPELPVLVQDGTKEMAFGCYDNVRVMDVPRDSMAHLFYLEQNAVFCAERPHVVGEGFEGRKSGEEIPAESFVDVIDRIGDCCQSLGAECQNKVVIFFGHSMAGAALSMLLGHGKSDGDGHLCFDGKYIMPNATPTKLLPQTPQ